MGARQFSQRSARSRGAPGSTAELSPQVNLAPVLCWHSPGTAPASGPALCVQTMVHTASGFTAMLAQQADLPPDALRQQAAEISALHVQGALRAQQAAQEAKRQQQIDRQRAQQERHRQQQVLPLGLTVA